MNSSKLKKISSLILFIVIFKNAPSEVLANNELHRGMMKGEEIRLATYQFPPLFEYKKTKDGNYTYGGLLNEVILGVHDYFDFRIKYVMVNQAEVSQFGLINALIRMLDKKQVDIVPYAFDQDFENMKHMEISNAVWIDPLTLMQPWPEEESRLKVTIRPFELPVWLCAIASTAAFILVTTAFIKYQERGTEGPYKSLGETMYSQLEFVLTIIASQGNSVAYDARTSFKILVGIWLLCMVVLVFAYTGVLTSLLSVPKLEPIVETVEDLAEGGKLRITIEKNTQTSREFVDATSGFKKIIGDQLRQDPTLLVNDAFQTVENVVHHKCAYLGTIAVSNYIVYEDTKANKGVCRMTTSPELAGYIAVNFQIGIAIGHPILDLVNEFILRLWASGTVSYIKGNHFPVASKCRTDNPPESNTRSLTLTDLAAPFFILGVGLSISITAFIFEVLSKYLITRIVVLKKKEVFSHIINVNTCLVKMHSQSMLCYEKDQAIKTLNQNCD